MSAGSGPIEALLLAAGRGDRLRPLTDAVAKPAIPMPGAPLGAWMLERLLGISERVAVNVSHLPPTVISQLSLEGRAQALPEHPDPFGTAGTLAALRQRVEQLVVVANGDAISDVDLESVLDLHGSKGLPATVVVQPATSEADFEMSGNEIVAFVDRRKRAGAEGTRFIGVSVLDRTVLDRLPETRPLGMGESLLAPLVRSGELAAYVHDGYVADVGTPGRYVDTCGDVLSGVAPPPPSGPYEDFAGEFIEVDGGRAFVADGAKCDREQLRRGAVVLAGAQLGAGVVVREAVVWPNERVPAGEMLERCVWFKGTTLR